MFLPLCLHVTVQIMRKITEQSTSQTFMVEKSFGTEGEHFSAHAIYLEKKLERSKTLGAVAQRLCID